MLNPRFLLTLLMVALTTTACEFLATPPPAPSATMLTYESDTLRIDYPSDWKLAGSIEGGIGVLAFSPGADPLNQNPVDQPVFWIEARARAGEATPEDALGADFAKLGPEFAASGYGDIRQFTIGGEPAVWTYSGPDAKYYLASVMHGDAVFFIRAGYQGRFFGDIEPTFLKMVESIEWQ